MAINNISPKKNKVVDIPDATITIGTPTAGNTSVSVAFTASTPATGGPVQKYTAVSNPGSFTGTASASPVTVSGLTNGTAYTFTVAAGNATGNGVFSSASASATPIAPAEGFVSLATTTVGAGGVASIIFSDISQRYKHLQIRGIARGTNSSAVSQTLFRINGDSGANYAGHLMLADGVTSPTDAYGYTSETKAGIGYGTGANSSANMFGAFVTDILDYKDTNKYKVVRSLGGADNNASSNYTYISYRNSLWLNTNAITSITIFNESGNLAQYSSFALYGIEG
jgi:hypothetical protein